MSEDETINQTTETTTRMGRKSVWIVRLLGLFLLLAQGAGLIVGGAYYFRKIAGDKTNASQSQNDNSKPKDMEDVLTNEPLFQTIDTGVDSRLYKNIFNPIGALIGLSAILFFFRFRGGWLLALLMEGAVLYVCLSLYFSDQLIPLIYPIMLYGIFMVLFLNSGAVRKAFLPRREKG
jgi:hypothetical protein